jgi:RNA polymerase sigma-70 factor (ECF subfamily)
MRETCYLETHPSSWTQGQFDRFLSDHYDRIYAVAYRILMHREDAEDVVQDVCLGLPEKLLQYRGGAKLTTWLHRIVVNRSLDFIKGASRRRARDAAGGELIASEACAQSLSPWLQDAVSGLDPIYRSTLALVIDEQMSHADAAEVLEIPPGTVSWRLSEVKRQLKKMARSEGLIA